MLFFFKQKEAYDMRISDWSSDVCSSDLKVDGKKVKVLSERDPAKLPWGKLGVDVVLECTGIFATKEAASKHLEGGAKKVLVSAPASGADITVVYGINHDQMKKKIGRAHV